MAVVGRVPDDLVVGLYVDGAPVDDTVVVDTVVVVDAVVGAIVLVVAVVGCFVVVVVVGTGVVVVVVGVVVVGAGVVVVVVVVVVGAGVVVVVVGVVVLIDGDVDVGKLRSPLQFRVRTAAESPIIVMICFLVFFFLSYQLVDHYDRFITGWTKNVYMNYQLIDFVYYNDLLQISVA